jgi:cell division protein FtsI (penicillin-binding protein 3)
VSTENYEREQVTFRTGVSGEMLRRAMEDAHPTPRTRVTSGTVLSGSSSRSVQPQLWDQDSFGQTPKEQNRHARDGEHPTSANSGRAVAVDEAAYGSDVIRVTPWHQTLIERFFTAPQPKDPLKSNGRLYFVLGCFLLAFGLVVVRLFKVQVVDHNQFSQAAANQYKMQVPIPARRGVIRDRNGAILATNAFIFKFAVDPKSIQDRKHLAELFANTFHQPVQHYLAIMSDTAKRYIVVEKEVPQEVAAALDSVKDHGLIRETESLRQYAYQTRASHILGFTGHDDRGLAGIELLENKELSGVSGFQIMERDGHRTLRPDVDYETVAPKDGEDVTLTIDESIQAAAESALKSGVDKAKAEAGIVIVMKPKTGEILALANSPDFDPNNFGKATNDDLRDRAITDAFEPGSIIKVITAAAALEDGAMKPNDPVYAEGGRWVSDGATFIDTHEYGMLTFRSALEKSSNISFAKISDKLDKRRFYKHVRDFGLGVYSGIDLPGEIKGYVRKPSKWGVNSKRYMAFGYELTATPMQMANAYSTIANMGVMMKPYVVEKRTTADGKEIDSRPQEIRRVVSEQTCRTLIDMMQGVVDSGTATTAKIKGLRIAGKTGTAQSLVDGHYSKDHYTSSFAGFFPAENPEYMILVMLRSPHNGYYGGAVSAPIWREIAMHILESNGKLPPEARSAVPATTPMVDEGATIVIDGTVLNPHEAQSSREMPEVRGLTGEAGRSLLASQGFFVIGATNADGIIERAEKRGGDSVLLRIRPRTAGIAEAEKVSVPDFVRLPMARAMKFGAMNSVRTKLVGQGNVARQFPEAGASVDKNGIVTLFGDE